MLAFKGSDAMPAQLTILCALWLCLPMLSLQRSNITYAITLAT
jgi:hypothetical protein